MTTSFRTTSALASTLFPSLAGPTREKLDDIVYELYGLTDEEIAVVEETVEA